MLGSLRQRIRDVRQGPDGFLYLVVDANPGGILRVEPVDDACRLRAVTAVGVRLRVRLRGQTSVDRLEALTLSPEP